MKMWFVLVLIVCIAGAVRAEEAGEKKEEKKGTTKEQYIEYRKKQAAEKGTEFDQAKAEAYFDKIDTDKDGIMSPEEKAKKKADKKKKAPKE